MTERRERREGKKEGQNVRQKKGKIGERVLGLGIFNPGEGQIKKS